jgi:hypothetical protein
MKRTIDTAAHKASDFGKTYANLIANRPAHALNDKLVTLREGTVANPRHAGGATLKGGHGHQGYVWAIADGVAVVDFGATSSGVALHVLAAEGDLVAVAVSS